MNTVTRVPARPACLPMLLVALLGLAMEAGAQPVDIPWWSIDCGGGILTGGTGPGLFTLHGTTGQPDSGATLSGGNFTLSGGFWAAPFPACPCDWNHNTSIDSQDFFDFLSSFFAAAADFNHDGLTNSQDFFDFLACFFAGC